MIALAVRWYVRYRLSYADVADWFAVPLGGGGYAVGLVARIIPVRGLSYTSEVGKVGH